ncbi:2-hydroxychromene-2-carboxylate isomerase [Noviherbaspirillum sp. CPCC 100848]|uniref:2-hydroxychromene-2-carboxylate isomerase n=1 Tax=Noviherbaspirillum album TaxID=3080276 RepID=A0ABU6JAC4_9BURK|nr:2-hydroxychromene-2-carboxylate isomerase [Noviherbaspirillum sp. CPCC 100848]MEC4720609.1 2-hydroxychromene-2-carboxylate isomerase [Noviherbaspirillum sp. CPCC 100848]
MNDTLKTGLTGHQPLHHTPPTLEFWFEFGSNYSYLSVMRIEALARDAGIGIAWKPFLLGPIFRDFGWSSSPFVLQEEKGRYVWRDMARQAAKHGLPFNKPSRFPRSAVLPLRVALLGAGQAWLPAFCRTVMRQNWVDDIEIDSADSVRLALLPLLPVGGDADVLIRQAQSEDNKLALRRQTEEARRRGIFGAPTFFVGDEMYWGDDRLDDAVLYAKTLAAR